MVTDLQSQDNKLHRLFEKFSNESKTVTIASIAMIVSLLSLLMVWMAVSDAKEAKVRAEYQEAHIEELSDKIEVMKVYITQHKAKHE